MSEDKPDKFNWSRLGEVEIDDSEGQGEPLIKPEELDDQPAPDTSPATPRHPRVKVHIHKE